MSNDTPENRPNEASGGFESVMALIACVPRRGQQMTVSQQKLLKEWLAERARLDRNAQRLLDAYHDGKLDSRALESAALAEARDLQVSEGKTGADYMSPKLLDIAEGRTEQRLEGRDMVSALLGALSYRQRLIVSAFSEARYGEAPDELLNRFLFNQGDKSNDKIQAEG